MIAALGKPCRACRLPAAVCLLLLSGTRAGRVADRLRHPRRRRGGMSARQMTPEREASVPRRAGRGGGRRLRGPRARRLEPGCGHGGRAHDGGRPAVQRRARSGAGPRRRRGTGRSHHGRQRPARRRGGRRVAREEPRRPGAPGDGQEPARAAGRQAARRNLHWNRAWCWYRSSYFRTRARIAELAEEQKAAEDKAKARPATPRAPWVRWRWTAPATSPRPPPPAGITNKLPGRVGDSPIIGAGTYANNQSCAVSATGDGEYFMRQVVAYDICALVAYRKLTLEQAVTEVVHEKLRASGGTGGVIAIDPAGNIVMDFNTVGMFRAARDGHGRRDIAVYRDNRRHARHSHTRRRGRRPARLAPRRARTALPRRPRGGAGCRLRRPGARRQQPRCGGQRRAHPRG